MNQYFTPTWACQFLIRKFTLRPNDIIADPACGDGRWLMAVPKEIEAFGVEIDPVVAKQAEQNSGRKIICADWLTADLPKRPTLIIGNPPFESDLITKFLARCHEELETGGNVGFILPAYYFQTAKRVMDLGKQWSISQELIPRNLFENLKMPICFAVFTKSNKPVLVGFCLYEQTAAVMAGLKMEYRKSFMGNRSRANVWTETVWAAMKMLGGQATLKQLYAEIEHHRPTNNPWWRQMIRKILQQNFDRIGNGHYAIRQQVVI